MVRTSIDTSKKIFEQLSILPKILFEQYRYFKNFVRTVSILHKFCSNSIDTSKMLFEQYRYFKTSVRTCMDTSKSKFEQVSILQKVSSFTALAYTVYHYLLRNDHRMEQCDVKLSKKRPLWLVWSNNDKMAQFLQKDFKIIFKNGDG